MTSSSPPPTAETASRFPADAGSGQIPCPVLWVTVAGYAAADVVQQAAWRDQLTERAEAALAGIPADQRIVLDIEAGLAVCFLSHPATATRVAASLLATDESVHSGPLKIGLAMGPVALVPARGDALPRLVGDGVVVAERMNEFAGPGEALACRAFVDATLPDSPARAKVLLPRGTRTDAQLRAHDVFLLDPLQMECLDGNAADAPAVGMPLWRSPRMAVAVATLSAVTLVSAMMTSAGHGSRPSAAIRVAALAPPSKADIAPMPAAIAGSHAALAAPATDLRTASPGQPSHPTPSVTTAPIVPASPPHGVKPPEPVAERKAVVSLAVSPWGEVFVNGKPAGVSPPLTEIDVKPGRVAVEVRNAGSVPYSETFTLQPGERVSLRHKF